MFKKCKNCGKIFSATHGNQKFCSKKCAVRYHQPTYKLEEIICSVCGKSFQPKVTWQIYCSKECQQLDYRIEKVLRKRRLKNENYSSEK